MSFPFDGSPCDKKIALVPHVLLCDAFGNGLRAFKLRPCIEIPAVFARPEVRAALGATAFQTDLHGRRDNSSAHRAPQNLLKTRHPHRTRTIPLLALGGPGLRLPRAHDAIARVVLVTTLPVFSFGHLPVCTSGDVGRLHGGRNRGQAGKSGSG